MDLQQLCSCIPKVVVTNVEAVQLLRASMEAINKVHKNPTMVYDDSKEAQRIIVKAIEFEIRDFDERTILWKGIYGEKPKVEYWFFMYGFLVIRGSNSLWSFVGRKLTKREWKKILEA